MVFLLLQPSWLKYHKKHRFQGDTSPRKRDTWKRLKPNLHLGMCSLPLSGCQLVLLYMMVTSNLASSMINLFPPYQVMLQCWIVSLCSLCLRNSTMAPGQSPMSLCSWVSVGLPNLSPKSQILLSSSLLLLPRPHVSAWHSLLSPSAFLHSLHTVLFLFL